MKLIDPEKADKRAELEKLRPFAKAALEILDRHKFLVSKAEQLASESGMKPDQGMHPFQAMGELISAYGKLALEVGE